MKPFDPKRLVWQKREKALYGGAVVFLILLWWLAIGPTISLRGEVQRMKALGGDRESIQTAMLSARSQLETLDASIGGQYAKGDTLFALLGAFAEEHDVSYRVNPESIVDLEKYRIAMRKIEVGGSFPKSLQLINLLEHQTNVGRVSSARFELSYDRRKKTDVFTATVWLQQIEPLP